MFEIIGIGIVSVVVLWIALSWDNDYDTMKLICPNNFSYVGASCGKESE